MVAETDMEAGMEAETGMEGMAGMEAETDMADMDTTEGMRRQTEVNTSRIFPSDRSNPLKSHAQPEAISPAM